MTTAIASRFRWLVLALLLLLGRSPLPAQTTGPEVLVGVVTDASDRGTLPMASVRLTDLSRRTTEIVQADAHGRFELHGLTGDRYAVEVELAGYVSRTLTSTAQESSAILVQRQNDGFFAPVSVSLYRGGVLTGNVTDGHGRPRAGVQVVALHEKLAAYTEAWSVRGQRAVTDDEGRYRIFGLPPGAYVIAGEVDPASVRSSNTTRRLSEKEVQDTIALLALGRDTHLTSPHATSGGGAGGLATTYYPGTPHVETAQAVTVALGEDRDGVSFAITEAPAAQLTVRVLSPWPGAASQAVVTLARSGLLTSDASSRRPDASGVIVFPSVAPGRYVILGVATGRASGVGQRLVAMAELLIAPASDVQATLDLLPSSNVRGIVRRESLGPAQTPGRLRLERTRALPNALAAPVEVAVGPDGLFSVAGLWPGEYRVFLDTSEKDLYIAKTGPPGQESQGRSFVVAEADVAVSLILSDKVGEVAGTLTLLDGRPGTGFQVVAVSDDGASAGLPRFRSAAVAPDGTYVLRNLPPGAYSLAAFPADLSVNYFDSRDVRDASIRSGVAVNVEPGAKRRVDVRIAPQMSQ